MIPREVIEEIKRRLDIVDVISEYINLERVGKNYRALCPFHTETRPSFYVSPELQMYKCFGCGASGDVIEFVKEIEKISFYEAVEKLAKKAGVDISRYKKGSGAFEKYASFMEALKEEYVKEFWRNPEAVSYMKERGFSEEDLKRFEIGYSPRGSDVPLRVMERLGLNQKQVLKYGTTSLVGGRLRDIFEGRIVFPIRNESGRVVAFGGRILGEGEPKYINSRDTRYFSKSTTLFLLDVAKSRIKALDVVVIVEGYMDAYALHRVGMDNAVAVLGTALTSHHASRLSGLTRNAVLALDSDEAGKRAALRSLASLILRGFDVLVVEWPRKDADDTLRELGGDGIKRAVEGAIPYEEFIVKVVAEKYDLSSASGLEKFAREIGEWASKIGEMIGESRSRSLLERASEISGLKIEDLSRFIREGVASFEEGRKITEEDELVFIFFHNEELREKILSVDREVLGEKMAELLSLYERFGDLNRALEEASKEIGDWVFRALKDVPPPKDPQKALDDVLRRLEIKRIRERLEEIDRMIGEVGEEERRILINARMELIRKMKALEKGGAVV